MEVTRVAVEEWSGTGVGRREVVSERRQPAAGQHAAARTARIAKLVRLASVPRRCRPANHAGRSRGSVGRCGMPGGGVVLV